jgi:hypothetical protein
MSRTNIIVQGTDRARPCALRLFLAILALACGRPDWMGAPSVVTEQPDPAVAGALYSYRVQASGGYAPRLWSLEDAPPALAWLSIDPSTGTLSGTPQSWVIPAQNVTVRVTDAKSQTSARVLPIVVLMCQPGQPFDCYSSDGVQCLHVSVRCQADGTHESCSGDEPSSSTSRCGPGVGDTTCGACSATAADTCHGTCQCGLGPPCSAAAVCCASNCVDIQTDVTQCGACGNACPAGPPNSTPVCSDGACGWACNPGFVPCSGACVDVKSDPTNCGNCGNVCLGSSGVCSAGSCTAACSEGRTNCSQACVDTQTDPRHCGSCDNACTAPPNSTADCTKGSCGFSCAPGLTPCGGACVDLAKDADNCGACGHVCPVPSNSQRFCSEAACGFKCATGYTNCGSYCARLDSDPGNCGACGRRCSSGSATTCCSSACVDTTSDVDNCGGCGVVCPQPNIEYAKRICFVNPEATSRSPQCAMGCPGPLPMICNGACVDPGKSPNCAWCGHDCGAQSCVFTGLGYACQ